MSLESESKLKWQQYKSFFSFLFYIQQGPPGAPGKDGRKVNTNHLLQCFTGSVCPCRWLDHCNSLHVEGGRPPCQMAVGTISCLLRRSLMCWKSFSMWRRILYANILLNQISDHRFYQRIADCLVQSRLGRDPKVGCGKMFCSQLQDLQNQTRRVGSSQSR